MANTNLDRYNGSTVKYFGKRDIGGYALKFTTQLDPDLYRDYFTKKTDFGLSLERTLPIYFNHTFDDVIKKARLGEAVLTATDEGLEVLGFIYSKSTLPANIDEWSYLIHTEREAYVNFILEKIASGEMGYSTGSAPHLVVRSANEDGTSEMKKWDIAELSITHTPAEPRTYAVIKGVNLKDFQFNWAELKAQTNNDMSKTEIKTLAEISQELKSALDSVKLGAKLSAKNVAHIETAKKCMSDSIGQLNNVLNGHYGKDVKNDGALPAADVPASDTTVSDMQALIDTINGFTIGITDAISAGFDAIATTQAEQSQKLDEIIGKLGDPVVADPAIDTGTGIDTIAKAESEDYVSSITKQVDEILKRHSTIS